MILRLFLICYDLLWWLLLPVVLIYLVVRGRKDAMYLRKLHQRFGFYRASVRRPVWIHAVSLGETRSALGLIRALLDRGEVVLTTHFTPAGLREAERHFSDEIRSGRVQAVWVPFDMRLIYGLFFRTFRPKLGLVMEVEIWPGMIFAARAADVPLFMCNAQYATRPLARDSAGLRLRQRVMGGFAGALVKSDLQAARFASVGVQNIVVTGELRFDQPIPQAQVQAAGMARAHLAPDRRCITIASAVEGEEPTYIAAIHALRDAARRAGEPPPLIVFVPRAPERFAATGALLQAEGWSVMARSTAFAVGAEGLGHFAAPAAAAPDILLGDSLGEMYFYLSLADQVVVGGGFTPRGAHNIIEPLAMAKPVLTGPYVWTIEYPFAEAELAGVARSVPDAAALVAALREPFAPPPAAICSFFDHHAGGVCKTMTVLQQHL